MAELTLKFAYKKTECYEKVMEEQEDWTTDLDDDDDPPAPIQRPPLQIRRRRSHFACDLHRTEHEQSNNMNFQLLLLMSIRFF